MYLALTNFCPSLHKYNQKHVRYVQNLQLQPPPIRETTKTWWTIWSTK